MLHFKSRPLDVYRKENEASSYFIQKTTQVEKNKIKILSLLTDSLKH